MNKTNKCRKNDEYCKKFYFRVKFPVIYMEEFLQAQKDARDKRGLWGDENF